MNMAAHSNMETGSAPLPLQPERYLSPTFAEREWHKVWRKAWLLLGKADEIPESGDFAVEEVGRESFLMARQADGTVKVFYNVCRHRGNRLVQVHDGALDSFICPYHHWQFGINGTLINLPDSEDAIGGNPCGRLNLVEVKSEVFAGFIWINMDPGSQSLREYLGPIWDQWSAFPMDRMTRYVAKSVTVPVNWKVIQDNFAESYHVQILHPEAIPFMEVDYRDMKVTLFENGHTLAQFPSYVPSRRQADCGKPLISPWLAERLQDWELDAADFAGREFETRTAVQQQLRALGPSRGYDYLDNLEDDQLTDFQHYTVFPNFSASVTFDGVQYLRLRPHATDPMKCILDHFWYGFSPPAITGQIMTTDGPVDRHAEVERQRYDYGEVDSGWQVEQDLSQALTQQSGVMSTAYQGANLMHQEGRLQHYASRIDEMMARE